MPRARTRDANGDASPTKQRSRTGCWPCKRRKVKCNEARPRCSNCCRFGDVCDYGIRLNWQGRARRESGVSAADAAPSFAFVHQPPPPSPGSRPAPSFSTIRHWHRRTPAASDAQDTVKDTSKSSRRGGASSPPAPDPVLYTLQTQSSFQSPVDPALLREDEAQRRHGLSQDTGVLSSSLSSSSSPSSNRSKIHVRRVSAPTLGFDQGRPDVDIPRNDDASALAVFSPSTTLKRLHVSANLTPPQDDLMPQFGFGFHGEDKDFQFRLDNYYAEPVAVQVPLSLGPLSHVLLANPMNLLYFHHFLNYTARILVPHDCPENPFRTVLPQMALQDDNLMHLLLAYAASHRARLLQHPEPKTRIAMWVNNVFSELREAISSEGPISDSSLATAIMQASLEIVSPNAFGVPIAWQSYLQTARAMIIARGGYAALRSGGQIASFLSRWFGYLDVCGSLSGTSYDGPLIMTDTDDGVDESDESDSELDCLLGVTMGCISKLAKVAALARQCDEARITATGEICADWQPSAGTRKLAQDLRHKLTRARPPVYKRCGHAHDAPLDLAEATAVNDAYHWAGLVQLECRVLGKEASDGNVQAAVEGIVRALGSVRTNSAAEACMVLPMFAAGCQAVTAAQREAIMTRLRCVELSGMSQVLKARTLMERVWATGRPWQTLVQGEFVG